VVAGRPSNLLEHLKRKRRANILRLERNGDEAISMLLGKQRAVLIDLLTEFKEQLDVLLFSGGGNDIVGKGDIEVLLNRRKPGMAWSDCINHTRFNRKLGQIRAAYQDLLDLRRDYCPECTIITHGYDWPIPGDQPGVFFYGAIKTGPWMHPFMQAKEINNPREQRAIAKYFIDRFNDMLAELARQAQNRKGFVYVDLRGKLRMNEWLNEIHPKSRGFGKLATELDAAIVEALRARGKV